jgi:hypothetical protein
MANQQQLIASLARRYGVDPRAALAIASVEGGFHGARGDHGTSFGPFQLHEGGALPQGRGSNWANSYAGINYAMQRIADVSHGMHGRRAVSAISSRFERPADVPGEIAKAMSRYGGGIPSGGSFPTGGRGGHMGSSGTNRAAILHFLQQIMAQQQSPMQSFSLPDALPVQRALYSTSGGTA